MSKNYAKSGVDLVRGREFVERLKPLAARTKTPGVMDSIGNFAAGFDLSVFNFKDPVLVSSTDGVGTKLKVAKLLEKHEGIGIDLVAMSVNDIIVCGARPLFFLDYFAMGKLHLETGLELITGITRGCQMSGCALIGGETAEMPGVYQDGDYDLAGFCVGAVERGLQRSSERVSVGDVMIGLDSSGPHSNGFSLIRKLITEENGELKKSLFQNGTRTYLDQIIEPTQIYVRPILSLLEKVDIHAMAHITGGGFFENIPRSLQRGQVARIDHECLPPSPLFQWLCELAGMDDEEPFHVWNMGVGFVLILDPQDVSETIERLERDGVKARVIGEVEQATESEAPPRVVME